MNPSSPTATPAASTIYLPRNLALSSRPAGQSGSKPTAPYLRGPEGWSQATSWSQEEWRGPQPSWELMKRLVGVCSQDLAGPADGTARRGGWGSGTRPGEGKKGPTPNLGRSSLQARLEPHLGWEERLDPSAACVVPEPGATSVCGFVSMPILLWVSIHLLLSPRAGCPDTAPLLACSAI